MSQPRGRKADTIVRAIEAKILNGGVVAWTPGPLISDAFCSSRMLQMALSH
jgi:hypothetical protein